MKISELFPSPLQAIAKARYIHDNNVQYKRLPGYLKCLAEHYAAIYYMINYIDPKDVKEDGQATGDAAAETATGNEGAGALVD